MIHFISGLPRSGSTLLAGILRQNPRFGAGIISPVLPLIDAMLRQMSMANETSVFVNDRHRMTMARAAFDAFHGGAFVSFDTNRGWCAKMPLIISLFPDAKVICCVRNVEDVLESIERFVIANCFQPSKMFNFSPDGTVYSRMEHAAANNGLVGYALNALREACYGEHREHLLLVRYETLVEYPEDVMAQIYAFLDEKLIEHDFDNVEMDAEEFDKYLGTPGLHRVKRKVTATVRTNVLPSDLYLRFKKLSFWNHNHFPVRTV